MNLRTDGRANIAWRALIGDRKLESRPQDPPLVFHRIHVNRLAPPRHRSDNYPSFLPPSCPPCPPLRSPLPQSTPLVPRGAFPMSRDDFIYLPRSKRSVQNDHLIAWGSKAWRRSGQLEDWVQTPQGLWSGQFNMVSWSVESQKWAEGV